MGETSRYTQDVGRPPKLNAQGDRLITVAIKVYPKDWDEFVETAATLHGGDRSSAIRKFMERENRKRAKSGPARATKDDTSTDV